MFIAIDEENKQVFGPFDSEEQGEDWVRGYIRTVEYPTTAPAMVDAIPTGFFDISMFLWSVQEVEFVDVADTTYGAFLGKELSTAEQDFENARLKYI